MSRTHHHRREDRKPKRDHRAERDTVAPEPADQAASWPRALPTEPSRVVAKGIVNGYLYLLDEALLAPSQHLLVFEHELGRRELERRVLAARRNARRRPPLAIEALLDLGFRRVVPAASWRRESKGWVVDAPASTGDWFTAAERFADEEAWVDGYLLAVDAGLRRPGFDYYAIPRAIDAATARDVFAESLALVATDDSDGKPARRSNARQLAEQIGRCIVRLGGRAATARVAIVVGRDQQVDCEEHVRLGVGAELDFVELAEQYTPQHFSRGRW